MPEAEADAFLEAEFARRGWQPIDDRRGAREWFAAELSGRTGMGARCALVGCASAQGSLCGRM